MILFVYTYCWDRQYEQEQYCRVYVSSQTLVRVNVCINHNMGTLFICMYIHVDLRKLNILDGRLAVIC